MQSCARECTDSVCQTIVSGISVLAYRITKNIYNDAEFSEKMAVSDLAQQIDNDDHLLFVNAATEFGVLFSKHALAL